MDEQNRTGKVTLVNTSTTTNSYRINWIEYSQDQNNNYVVETNSKSPASRILSYSPRQVTLEPQQAQTIRLRYRANRVAEDGEYRSHLRMTALAPEKDDSTIPSEKTSISIGLQLSFDLPIIVRKGKGDLSVKLGEIEVIQGRKDNARSMAKLKVPFHHSGTFSGTGSLRIFMQTKAGSDLQQIGTVNNLNVFPNSQAVTKTIPLNISHIPAGAAIKVTYEGSKEYKDRLFAEKIFRYEPSNHLN